ncbi:MAG TPA: hypothetical protein VIJ01_01130 [Candidatus Angelobacter sp.]
MTTKNSSLVPLVALCATAFFFTANVTASAQDAAAQTKAEIERLQQSLKDKPHRNP